VSAHCRSPQDVCEVSVVVSTPTSGEVEVSVASTTSASGEVEVSVTCSTSWDVWATELSFSGPHAAGAPRHKARNSISLIDGTSPPYGRDSSEVVRVAFSVTQAVGVRVPAELDGRRSIPTVAYHAPPCFGVKTCRSAFSVSIVVPAVDHDPREFEDLAPGARRILSSPSSHDGRRRMSECASATHIE
jgi:hypothetical protein